MGDYYGFYARNLELKHVLPVENLKLLKRLVDDTLCELTLDQRTPNVSKDNLELFELWGKPDDCYWHIKHSFHQDAYLGNLKPSLNFDHNTKSYKLTFCLIYKDNSNIFSFLRWLKPLIKETANPIGYIDYSDHRSLDHYTEEDMKENVFLKDIL